MNENTDRKCPSDALKASIYCGKGLNRGDLFAGDGPKAIKEGQPCFVVEGKSGKCPGCMRSINMN